MARRIARLTLDSLPDLGACSACLFWQVDPVQRSRAQGREADDLAAWLSVVLREWGSCGRLVYVDDVAAGHVLYAPALWAPGAAQLPTAPASEDAVLLLQARVAPVFRGQGLGRVLVQALAKDLVKRGGVKAVEAFGTTGGAQACVVPADFLLSVGFRTHRAHPVTPRMRMDLRSTLTWRSEIESAVDRLLAPVRVPAAPPTVRDVSRRS